MNVADEILKGCACGGRLFFFVKKSKLEDSKKEFANLNLSSDDRSQIESDVFDMMGTEVDDSPVILDIEAVRIIKPGKYELDLVHLFKGEPLVYKLEEGKYMIDVVESLKRVQESKKKRTYS